MRSLVPHRGWEVSFSECDDKASLAEVPRQQDTRARSSKDSRASVRVDKRLSSGGQDKRDVRDAEETRGGEGGGFTNCRRAN